MSDWKKYVKISYEKLISQILNKARIRKDIKISTYGSISYKIKGKNKKYIFYKIASKNLKKFKKVVIITSGIHGEEQAGPLSILEYLNKIIDCTHRKKIGIIIYPCTNPSGFDQRTRYNAKKEVGLGNNFFIIYKKIDGSWADDLGIETEYIDWKWADDSQIKKKKLMNYSLPYETKLLLKDLRKLPLKKINGGIDLHQDYFKEGKKTYAYYFGNKKNYIPIIKKASKIIPPIKNASINSGYEPTELKAPKTDNYGLILRYDGTIGQLFYNYGAKYFITVETTKNVPVKKANKINFIWIKEIINLISKTKAI